MTNVKMKDVAKKAGVSLKTVSRVVNNEPNVTPATEELVLQAIADLGFIPNTAARRLALGKAMTIGLVMGWPVNSTYSAALIESVLKNSNSQGYGLVLFSIEDQPFDKVIQAYLGKQIDGVITDTIASLDDDLKKQLSSLNVPFLIIHPNSTDEFYNASYVMIDDKNGAKKATNYLIELDHRYIGFLYSESSANHVIERLNGYREALADANIPFQEQLVIRSSLGGFQAGFESASRLLSTVEEVTAIFCSTDEIAMGAMSAIWQAGLKVPDDISVVGFDDTRYARMLVPPLTTVHQPIAEIAEVAVEHLIEMIDDPDTERGCTVLLTHLIVRDTSKPPRK